MSIYYLLGEGKCILEDKELQFQLPTIDKETIYYSK